MRARNAGEPLDDRRLDATRVITLQPVVETGELESSMTNPADSGRTTVMHAQDAIRGEIQDTARAPALSVFEDQRPTIWFSAAPRVGKDTSPRHFLAWYVITLAGGIFKARNSWMAASVRAVNTIGASRSAQ
jgi:hypothetical protein